MVDSSVLVLYYFSSVAGLVMVLGGMLLLYQQKIYIDRESGQVTEIETALGKFKTNVPALVLFVLGFGPLTYPMYQLGPTIARRAELTESFIVHGNVRATYPIAIHAVSNSKSLPEGGGEFSMKLPLLRGGEDYTIIYVVGTHLSTDMVPLNKVTKGEIALKEKVITVQDTPQFRGSVLPVPADFKP